MLQEHRSNLTRTLAGCHGIDARMMQESWPDVARILMGTADETFARGRENTILSFAYVELYAPSIGLGTCWAGLLEAAFFSGFSSLPDLMKIPEGRQFTGALMVGYPKIAFRRLVDRNPLDLTFQDA